MGLHMTRNWGFNIAGDQDRFENCGFAGFQTDFQHFFKKLIAC